MKNRSALFGAAVAAVGLCSSAFATDYLVTDSGSFSTPLTGADTLSVDLTEYRGILHVYGDNSDWSGVLDVQHGRVIIHDEKTVGTAKLFCTNNVNTASTERESAIIFEGGTMTIANDIRLSTSEKNKGWNARLVASSNTTVNLTGKLKFDSSFCIRADGPWGKPSTLNVISPIEIVPYGNKKYFGLVGGHVNYSTVNFTETIYRPNDYITLNNLVVKLLAETNALNYVSCAASGGSRLQFVQDNSINDAFLFRNNNGSNDQALELDNTQQTIGGWKFDQVKNKVVVRNSNTNHAKRAVLTAKVETDQTGMLEFRGALDFRKTGASTLTVTNDIFGIHGTLTVSEGTLCLVAGTNTIANAIVIDGGTLDLGGRTWYSPSFTMSAGTLRNGTLIAGMTAVSGGTVDATATLRTQPSLEKTGAGTLVLSAAPGTPVRVSTNGLLCCYHFDQADCVADASKGMTFVDAGPYGYTLKRAWKSVDTTCATAGMRFGDGCLHMTRGTSGNGSERLQLDAGGYPAKFPLGAEPFTVALYFKADLELPRASYALYSFGYNDYTDTSIAKGERLVSKLDTADYTSVLSLMEGVDGKTKPNYNLVVNPADGRGLADGAWHSYVEIWDGTRWRYYIDGAAITVPDGSRKVTDPPAISNRNEKGAFYLCGSFTDKSSLVGYMDEFAMWGRALSADEVMAYHARGVDTAAAEENTALSVAGGAVELGAGVTLPAGTDYAVAVGATLKSAETLSVSRTLTLGGTIDGDLDLENGVTLAGDATTAVTGTVTVKGTGTFVVEGTPAAYPAEWTLFTAGAYAGEANLDDWTLVGANLRRRYSSAFGVTGNRLWASATLYGMTLILK